MNKIKTIFLLIKRDVVLSYKLMLIYFLASLLISTIVEFATFSFGALYLKIVLIYLFISILTSFGFSNQNKNKPAFSNYLLLPATALEKFAAKYFLTLIASIICAFLLIFIPENLVDLLLSLVSESAYIDNPEYDPQGIFSLIVIYGILLHSIVFWGTYYFQSVDWVKTVIIIILIIFCLSFLRFQTFLWFFDPTQINRLNFRGSGQQISASSIIQFYEIRDNLNFLILVIPILFSVLFAWLSYSSLKEREA